MGPCPGGLTIDRIDNYSCGHCDQCQQNNWQANCRWATYAQQRQNRFSVPMKIRSRAANGDDAGDLAQEYGVTRAYLREIINGRKWKR